MTVVNLHTITIAGIYLFFAFLDYDLDGPEYHGKPTYSSSCKYLCLSSTTAVLTPANGPPEWQIAVRPTIHMYIYYHLWNLALSTTTQQARLSRME